MRKQGSQSWLSSSRCEPEDEVDHGLLTRYRSALVHEDEEADTESERESLISRGRKKERHSASSVEKR